MSRSQEIAASHYEGCGNDFILIDNRQDLLPQFSPGLVRQLCQQEKGNPIDGLILVCSSKNADVSMKFFNCDGNEAEMCGNGVRCLMQFLRQKLSYPRTRCLLETKKRDLLIRCEDDEVVVHMGQITAIEWNIELACGSTKYLLQHVNSGVPHVVIFVPDVDAINVQEVGAYFRSHPHFGQAGTNVNFVEITNRAPPHTA
ncbi:MAG: diaminopimelate epimerase, partial [Verrucomicrobia bacterium]|nr:diaminopimelate epimerase [Verrucomicrobiota bacterium]